MGRLNWSGFDGAEFESLVHSLLFFEEPGVILFGRPGKDNGQDAISGDKTHVYQAKYGCALGIKEAIERSAIELKNIRKKLSPDHEDYKYWSKVTHWTLVANFEKNPSDQAKWESEIVSAYSDLHFTLDYWDATDLEALLTSHPDVEQAYFQGRNRSFVGLWEARRSLEKGILGEYFFATKPYGWNCQLQKIDEFAESAQNRFLFVYGKAEIGKTRFLYESAVRMSENGWRVLWGLTDSMSRSDAWMTGITGANKKVCLVVDAPKSSALVNAIYEQLSAVDKCLWKVVISCQQYEFNDWFRENSLRSDTACIELTSLDEATTKDYVSEFAKNFELRLPDNVTEGLLALTKGVPGWIALVLGYSHKNKTPLCLGERLLNVVSEQVRKAMEGWDSTVRERRLNVLRWACVWKTLVVDDGRDENALITFLRNELELQSEQVYDDLKSLVDIGLLVCWGRNRQIYTAEPTLVRQHVLSEWLLKRVGNSYHVTKAGQSFIKKLINLEIPDKESIVDNLAGLTLSYLGVERSIDFFRPIVDALINEVDSGGTVQQFAVFEWAKRIARVDPESALSIVTKIWNTPKHIETIRHRYWGSQTYEHSQVLAKIPSFLFSLSEMRLAKAQERILWRSFKQIYAEEKAGKFKSPHGQGAEEQIKRRLQSIRSTPFQEFAFEDLVNDCKNDRFSEFDIVLAEGLLSCKRETIEAFRYQVVFSHLYIEPGTPEWKRAIDTRALMFELIEQNKFPSFTTAIWALLAGIHAGWRTSEMLDERCAQKLGQDYDAIVLDDLRRTCSILKSKSNGITRLELESARHLWSRALKHGKSEEEKSLAAACEEEYAKHYSWDYCNFFSWDIEDEDLKRVVYKIREFFASAMGPEEISKFFEEAAEYLHSKDPGNSIADCGRGHDLAITCGNLYVPDGKDAFSVFVESSLQLSAGVNGFRDNFLLYFLRIWIRTVRATRAEGNIVDEIKRLVGTSLGKEQLLANFYEGMSSTVIGAPSFEELSYICSPECKFGNQQLARILPSFLTVNKDFVLQRFECILDENKDNQKEIEHLWQLFMLNSYLVMLRTDNHKVPSPIKWLLEAFRRYNMNGDFLADHELTYLAKRGGYTLSQREFVNLVRSRIDMEKSNKAPSGGSVMPHGFDVKAWVSMEKDESAINDLCELSIDGTTFLAVYQLPEYIHALDEEGTLVGGFVTRVLASDKIITPAYLRDMGGLAAYYEERSDAWMKIVEPICRYMNISGVSRDDRYGVYQSFQRKSHTWWSKPGEVPSEFIEKEATTRMAMEETSSDSDLYEYYKWSHSLADWELEREKERAEEERHV